MKKTEKFKRVWISFNPGEFSDQELTENVNYLQVLKKNCKYPPMLEVYQEAQSACIIELERRKKERKGNAGLTIGDL